MTYCPTAKVVHLIRDRHATDRYNVSINYQAVKEEAVKYSHSSRLDEIVSSRSSLLEYGHPIEFRFQEQVAIHRLCTLEELVEDRECHHCHCQL